MKMTAHLSLLLIAATLTACSDTNDGAYQWHANAQPAATYEWRVVAHPAEGGCAVDSIGCAVILNGHPGGQRHCLVASRYSEAQARAVYVNGSRISHFDHEVAPGSIGGFVNMAAKTGHCAGNGHGPLGGA